ncbi:hypothetical protein CSC94_05480 [Zhengella mangrovi]|uniref:Uncharacterized protein n=1 Tax=Zhengella mangrovi TaxID=1982044 RepID=A0A2G1QRM7_9HYPH|nr:DUF6105 family protein [Zhengella mangrovi]PHP68110.1 hypothetical protein CSC94_05480 [Zhengella mangrovi]
MRYILILWAAPIGLFGVWYFLSLNDMNFGTIFLSRALHDAVFELYGEMLGVAPDKIPLLILEALAFDSLFIAALYAYRRRKLIRAWWVDRKARAMLAAAAASMAETQAAGERPAATLHPAE